MPIPDDYAREALYAPDAWFLHDLERFPDEGRVVGTCDTTRLGALVDAQREIAGHELHVPGAVMIQITGVLAHMHVVYLHGMRSSEGWTGYGTHIHQATFRRLGRIGPPMACECRLLRKRPVRGTLFTRFAFEYTQEGEVVYSSEQTAAWIRR